MTEIAAIAAITKSRVGSQLRLVIVDDGPGTVAPDAGRGIGLSNTSARLTQPYGTSHSLELGRRIKGGVSDAADDSI